MEKSKNLPASPLTRNHSLKYTGGSLHLANPVSFDHVYSGGSMSDVRPPSESHLRACGRSQSFKLPSLVRVKNQSPERSSPSLRIPGTSHPRIVRRRKESTDDDYDDEEDFGDVEDEDDEGNHSESSSEIPTIFCTPPHRQGSSSFLHPASKREARASASSQSSPSIIKSRSMTNLISSDGGNKGAVYRKVLASHARMRSFLLGSVCRTSLLGVEELQRFFPDRALRIFVGTWNMNGASPPRHLADFLLPERIEYVPDVLVIGTQETFPERTEWEIRLQDTLGPSHVLYHSHYLGTLHLTIFLRRDLIWFCSVPDVDSFNTRPGAQFKTKGAVAVALIIFGTSFLFINSHLTAHEENVKERVKDLNKLNAMLNIPKILPIRKRSPHLSDNFDVVFWCGDLNFRLDESRDVVIKKVEDGMSVLEFDQLNSLRINARLVFKGFEESKINFPPTYKYDPGTNDFDTSSKQRTPAYTDRILYKVTNTAIKPLHYDSVRGLRTSDHKPVWGMWEVKIRPGKDSIPLAGGLFNREVYLEGLKRRSEALQPSFNGKDSNNTMCNMQ